MATTSLPAVDRPNADSWNAARSRQNNPPGPDDAMVDSDDGDDNVDGSEEDDEHDESAGPKGES